MSWVLCVGFLYFALAGQKVSSVWMKRHLLCSFKAPVGDKLIVLFDDLKTGSFDTEEIVTSLNGFTVDPVLMYNRASNLVLTCITMRQVLLKTVCWFPTPYLSHKLTLTMLFLLIPVLLITKELNSGGCYSLCW